MEQVNNRSCILQYCSRVYNNMLIRLKSFYSTRIRSYSSDISRQELQMSPFCGTEHLIVACVTRMLTSGWNWARTSSVMLMIMNHDVPRYSTVSIPELLRNSFISVSSVAFCAVSFRSSILSLSSVLNFFVVIYVLTARMTFKGHEEQCITLRSCELIQGLK
jgi:hypothetical protein